MLRGSLSCGAKIVYGYLKYLAWKDSSDEAAATREAIQKDLGIGKNQVTAYIQELAQEPVAEGDRSEGSVKLVETLRQGRGLPNIYVLNDPVTAPKVIPISRNTPEKAHKIVNDAIGRGLLVRQPCEVCGATGKGASGRSLVHAHHDDYTKPLEVRWLCQRHHSEYHQYLRSAGRAPVR